MKSTNNISVYCGNVRVMKKTWNDLFWLLSTIWFWNYELKRQLRTKIEFIDTDYINRIAWRRIKQSSKLRHFLNKYRFRKDRTGVLVHDMKPFMFNIEKDQCSVFSYKWQHIWIQAVWAKKLWWMLDLFNQLINWITWWITYSPIGWI